MKKAASWVVIILIGMFLTSSAFAQDKEEKTSRRPPSDARPQTQRPNTGGQGPWWILDGMPMLYARHHDTEVGTNNPVDVDELVIEMQVMNSDGNLEPVGLQIHNFFTAHPQDAKNDFNTHNGRDCHDWSGLISNALRKKKNHPTSSRTWPYIEFIVEIDARILQTNEDGAVFYADDIECWGAMDRFPPF
jgi:hypothetical protein